MPIHSFLSIFLNLRQNLRNSSFLAYTIPFPPSHSPPHSPPFTILKPRSIAIMNHTNPVVAYLIPKLTDLTKNYDNAIILASLIVFFAVSFYFLSLFTICVSLSLIVQRVWRRWRPGSNKPTTEKEYSAND